MDLGKHLELDGVSLDDNRNSSFELRLTFLKKVVHSAERRPSEFYAGDLPEVLRWAADQIEGKSNG